MLFCFLLISMKIIFMKYFNKEIDRHMKAYENFVTTNQISHMKIIGIYYWRRKSKEIDTFLLPSF